VIAGGRLDEVSRSVARILVVDDEPWIVEVMASILQLDAYAVDTAANGAEALMWIEQHDYDAILADVRMPVLDGAGLYRALQDHRPELCQRLAFVTGDVLDPATQAFLGQADVPVLEKPFRPDEVLRLVRQLLA
jgi:two-component system NtrC family sensor kinase